MRISNDYIDKKMVWIFNWVRLPLDLTKQEHAYCDLTTFELHTNPSSLYDASSLTLREKTNQKTDQEQFIRSTAPTPSHLYRWDRQKFNHTTNRTQTSNKRGWRHNNIAEHHLKTSHAIDWDSATCLTYSTDYYQRITLESWFTKLEETALSRCRPLPAPYKRLLNRKQ